MYSSVPTSDFTFTFRAPVPSSNFTFTFPLSAVMQSAGIFIDDPMDLDEDSIFMDDPMDVDEPFEMCDFMDIDPPVLIVSVRAVGIGPHAMWSRYPHRRA
ncbi:unnamed protein product [Rhizopus stolonifer]